MVMPHEVDPRTAFSPMPVIIQNWTDNPVPKPDVRKTSVRTFVLDVTGAVGPKNDQICGYEPNRKRLVIQVIDQAVILATEAPNPVTDTTSATVAPQNPGRLLPASTFEYVFYGADAFWLISTNTTTRVTVTREYA